MEKDTAFSVYGADSVLLILKFGWRTRNIIIVPPCKVRAKEQLNAKSTSIHVIGKRQSNSYFFFPRIQAHTYNILWNRKTPTNTYGIALSTTITQISATFLFFNQEFFFHWYEFFSSVAKRESSSTFTIERFRTVKVKNAWKRG